MNHRLVQVDVRRAHAQDLYNDVCGGFAQLSALHHVLETLWDQRALRNILVGRKIRRESRRNCL